MPGTVRLLTVLSALLAAGCAGIDPYAQVPISAHLERDDDVGRCARLLRDADARIDAAGTRDAGASRVPGFPYLRVDRFTASLDGQAAGLGGAGFAAWSELMAQLDRRAREAELANAGKPESGVPIDACRYVLAVADGGEFARLRESAVVADDYDTAMRALGLYPLTRLAFVAGIRAWQQRTREVFGLSPDELPRAGELLRYAPGPQPSAPAPPLRSAAFALPAPAQLQLRQWAQQHAPLLEIDTASDDDRIGALHWTDGEAPAANVAAPAAYLRVAYTHFAGRVRLQLVYTFWFPARPADGPFDPLAGRLDGLLWRVTLDEHGQPLVYDSIHPCGCYHLFFPTDAVVAKPQPVSLDEGLFAPQQAPTLEPGQRIALRLAARTHYLQRVSVAPADAPGIAFSLVDEARLSKLPWPGGGTRSAYDAAGFVPGTERAERWLFWPMGIASAGQMRQWGRHATAFVGRRHFDDARLLDEYFALRPGERVR